MMEKYQKSLLMNYGNWADVRILCAGPGVTKLGVPHFASVNGRDYRTDEFDLASYGVDFQQVMAKYHYPMDITADAIIVFPDGFSVQHQELPILMLFPTGSLITR